MSLLNSASLVVTPNAYKEGTLYSVIPNTTLGDMTVVRATTATRVNSAGLIELVPYNLFTYSEQFNNADWQKRNNIAITTNATTSPDGTLTADKMYLSNNLIADYGCFQIITSASRTFSVYAKKAELQYLFLGFNNDNASEGVFFNLNTGAISQNTGAYTATISDAGNGWYRCTAYFPTISYCFISPSINGTSFLVTGQLNNGIYIWGAQVNEGTTAKDYLRTETRLNIPRLDYSNGSCPSLLVEPQRTNLALRSEEFDNASWTKTRLTISANTSVSPDGFTSADSVFETTDNNTHLLFQRPNVTATNPFTFSCFVKANGRRRLNLQIFDSSTLFASALFDVISGVVIATNGTSKIEDYGNGWYRCAISNVSPTTSLGYAQIGLATDTYTDANVLDSYVGDVTKGVLLYGAQFELGSYPTSYIPTTSAAVTRNADVISKTGISSLIGTSEGSAYFNGNISDQGTGSAVFFEIVNGTSTTNTIVLYIDTANGRAALYLGTVGLTPYLSSTSKQGQNVKIAFRWKANDYAFYLDGTQVYTNTSAAAPSGMNTLRVGNNRDGTDIGKNLVNQVVLFPTALTNAELAQLTTL